METRIKELEQKVAEQAVVIEKLLSKLGEIAGSKSLTATPTQFYQHLQRLASDATITTDSKQVLQDWLDGVMGEPAGWEQLGVDAPTELRIVRPYLPTKFNSEWWKFEPLYRKPVLK